ncbi:putative nucleobase-ascorbate transporter 10 [Forsythia ovata]|uniref:Nucleobase-ascorbate transporter 10 n=1 Tax=Forsythia ovata TaxID=205694 RepID=A0ABD1UWS5_9LAMI
MSASGNNAGANQPEEPQPHPVLEQLTGVQYCVNSPPPFLETLILGFQHYVLSLGSIVLIPSMTVPQMGGSDKEKAKVIQTLLFVSGVNTLFHSLFGTRLPVVIGGSYAFLIPVTTILRSRRYQMIQQPEERFAQTMREIQGTLIVTSCFQMIIGFIGLWRNIIRLFSPLSMIPLVLFTGLGFYHLGFPLIAQCVEVGIPELLFMIFISQYLPRFIKLKRPICDRFAVLFSVSIVWIYAGILTWSGAYHKPSKDSCRTDRSGLITGAPWIYVPFPFQWGPPTFRAREIFATVMASFVASAESTGVYLAAARYGSATPVPPSVISRGIGWLGIGTLLNGLFGSVTGSAATAENAGLLALTKAGSRRVVQISAAFMIFFSFLGKFGAIFAAIPLPIMGAIYCICFGYVASVGLGFLQFCNLNNFRTKLVLGFSLFIGLSLPQYFREYHLHSMTGPVHTHATWFNDIICVIFMSHVTVAAIVALVLDCSLPHGSDGAHKDNGAYWWERFMVYNKDVRNNEFYKLPGQLNKFFPAF